ncbi:MAG: c-type cytochrome [Bacteroidia bacterium]|nr:c-type cytochrome [Bacteroidia bacterium]MCX7764339.1 c-type cytochrome [Bacteroidia bacterium]MDW8056953.1 c-type cytochrome [Bacteroidia bacterium]
MDTGILHTHHLLAVLLLILVGAPVVFPKGAASLKKLHMVLDTLLILTGAYLLFKAPGAFSPPYLLKYILTIGAIVAGVIGSRRGNRKLSIAAFFLLVYAYGLSLQRDFLLRSEKEQVKAIATQSVSIEGGKQLYQVLCLRCHGADGKAHYRKSPHPMEHPDSNYQAHVIRHGKGIMPSHEYLTDTQVKSLLAYLRTLR